MLDKSDPSGQLDTVPQEAPTATVPTEAPQQAKVNGIQAQPASRKPAIAALTPGKVARLTQRGYDRLRWVRESRLEGMRNVVGRHYGARTGLLPQAAVVDQMQTKRMKQAINLHAQHVKTLVTYLTSNPPEAEIEPRDSSLEFEAVAIKTAMDEDAERMRLRDKYQELVIECAISGFAVNKIGIKAGSAVFSDGTTEIDPGEIYEEPVDIDDYVVDPLARRFSEKRFHGHRVRVNKSSVLQSKVFGHSKDDGPKVNQWLADESEVEGILNAMTTVKSATGSTNDRVSSLAEGGDKPLSAGDEDDEMVEVWEEFWYMDGTTYRIVIPAKPGTAETVDLGATKFLAIEEYEGPEDGPLEILTFLPIQSSVIPLSLDQWQRDLALAMESLGNKLIQQGLKGKRVHIYDPAFKDEIDRLRQAPDGEFIAGDPSKVTTVEMAGMQKDALQAVQYLWGEWNNMTGNMQLASGANDVGKTATAFSGLLGRVQGFMAFLQGRIEDFASRCLRRRVWWFITDPLMERQIPYRISDTYTVPVTFSAEAKQGRFEDFSYKVSAASMAPMDPTMEVNAWTQFFTQVAPALANGIKAQIYKPSILRVTARKFRLKEIDQALNDQTLDQMAQQASQQQLAEFAQSGPAAIQGLPRTMPGSGGGGWPKMPDQQNQPPAALPGGAPMRGTPIDALRSVQQGAGMN